jgi:hypothetical protein
MVRARALGRLLPKIARSWQLVAWHGSDLLKQPRHTAEFAFGQQGALSLRRNPVKGACCSTVAGSGLPRA